jgi:hypothetical protein
MRCAVVLIATGEVINIIVAEPTDPAPDDCELIALPDDSPADIGWYWDGSEFIDPNPSPPEEYPGDTDQHGDGSEFIDPNPSPPEVASGGSDAQP